MTSLKKVVKGPYRIREITNIWKIDSQCKVIYGDYTNDYF